MTVSDRRNFIDQNSLLGVGLVFIDPSIRKAADNLVRNSSPSSVIAMLNAQADKNKTILHMLHYIPERRGRNSILLEVSYPYITLGVSKLTGK